MSAACLTLGEFLARTGEEFATVDPIIMEDVLTATCATLGEAWGEQKSLGHLYLTAHHLSILKGSGAEAGQVTARSIGGISISYASPTMLESDVRYLSSKWGRLYVLLRDSLIVGPVAEGYPTG